MELTDELIEQKRIAKNEYNRIYRQTHAEELKKYRLEHNQEYNEYNKKYRERHKDYFKDYYYANHEHINKKFNCECGGKYTLANRSGHFKSNKHKMYEFFKNKFQNNL